MPRWPCSGRHEASRLEPDDPAPIPRGAGSSHVRSRNRPRAVIVSLQGGGMEPFPRSSF